jgi:hypothetical protein
MSSVTGLQGIINETKAAFVIAKFDGKLEASEVVQIATEVAMKVHALSVGSLDEKKALVALALKKGLAAADGLHGLADLAASGPAGVAAAEKQVLDAALAAVNALLGAAPHLFAPAQTLLSSLKRSLSRCLPFCSQVAALAEVVDPKDSALIAEALKAVEKEAPVPVAVQSTLESVEVSVSQEIVPVACELHTLEEVLDENIGEMEPSLAASLPEAPVLEVPGTPA